MTAVSPRWTWRETEDAEVEIVSNGTVSYRVMGGDGDGETLARALNEGEAMRKGMAPEGWVPRDLYTQAIAERDAARRALHERLER